MTMQRNGLTKLQEECAEVIQVIAKLEAFPTGAHPGYKRNLWLQLEDEIADINAAALFLVRHGEPNKFNDRRIAARSTAKLEQFIEWHKPGGGKMLLRPEDCSALETGGSLDTSEREAQPVYGQARGEAYLAAAAPLQQQKLLDDERRVTTTLRELVTSLTQQLSEKTMAHAELLEKYTLANKQMDSALEDDDNVVNELRALLESSNAMSAHRAKELQETQQLFEAFKIERAKELEGLNAKIQYRDEVIEQRNKELAERYKQLEALKNESNGNIDGLKEELNRMFALKHQMEEKIQALTRENTALHRGLDTAIALAEAREAQALPVTLSDLQPRGPGSHDTELCSRPPAGYYCTRPAGHEGPCAAHSIEAPGIVRFGVHAQEIADIFVKVGFRPKNGADDLKSYVYTAAFDLLEFAHKKWGVNETAIQLKDTAEQLGRTKAHVDALKDCLRYINDAIGVGTRGDVSIDTTLSAIRVMKNNENVKNRTVDALSLKINKMVEVAKLLGIENVEEPIEVWQEAVNRLRPQPEARVQMTEEGATMILGLQGLHPSNMAPDLHKRAMKAVIEASK